MHQRKGGVQWYFGNNIYVGVDKNFGLIHWLGSLTPTSTISLLQTS